MTAAPTTIPTSLALLADETLLDHRLAVCRTDDATLDDIRSLLALTGRMLPQGRVDPIRATGILHVAVEALARFDTASRCAPPKALAEVVREFGTSCPGVDCSELVFPWEADGSFCGDECRRRGAE